MLCRCMGHNLVDLLARMVSCMVSCSSLHGYDIFACRFNRVPVSFYVKAGWMMSTTSTAGVSPYTVFGNVALS